MVKYWASNGTFHRVRTHRQGRSISRLGVIIDNNIRNLNIWAASSAAVAGATSTNVNLKHFCIVIFQIVQIDSMLLLLKILIDIGRGHFTGLLTSVFLVWVELLCLCWINNTSASFVKSKPVKQEVSHTIILPLMKKWVFSGVAE